MKIESLSVDLGSSPLCFHAAWSGFWKKSLKERQAQLASLLEKLWGPGQSAEEVSESHGTQEGSGAKHHSKIPKKDVGNRRKGGNGKTRERALPKLDDQYADLMIENCIGTISLPVGLGLNFTINKQPVVVPMCVEESSVVAAASSAAKIISLSGGFVCTSSPNNVVSAQVQLCLDSPSAAQRAIAVLHDNRDRIIQKANEFCPGMVKRGGGVVDIAFYEVAPSASYAVDCCVGETLPCWVIANVKIDVCDAMGANCANTVAEGISGFLSELSCSLCGVRIVSNFLTDKYSTASFCIPVDSLAYKDFPGITIANKIVQSNIWAACDIGRATTHNKGIMNGVDAVALATGQDWRAIEAAAHAYATVKDPRSGYAPLTDYWIDSSPLNCSLAARQVSPETCSQRGPLYLHGSISLPIPTGVKGGALSMNSAYSSCLKILGPDVSSKKLAEIIVAVGLAQNFAALRALCTAGIQSGHMALHAQNIAVMAGVPAPLIPECVGYMKSVHDFSLPSAKSFLSSRSSSLGS